MEFGVCFVGLMQSVYYRLLNSKLAKTSRGKQSEEIKLGIFSYWEFAIGTIYHNTV